MFEMVLSLFATKLLWFIFIFVVVTGLVCGDLKSFTSKKSLHEHCRNFSGATLFCRHNLSTIDYQVCYYCANSTAVCRAFPNRGMICQHGIVRIQDCYCVTYNYRHDYLEFGRCMSNCNLKDLSLTNDDEGYRPLPTNVSKLNSTMCGMPLNRNKTLCGRCNYGYYPMAVTYNISCIQCPEFQSRIDWLYLTLLVLIPLTTFCFVLMLFKVNATSSYLHGFVLFSQALSMPAVSRMILMTLKDKPSLVMASKFIGSVFSLWSLDILRPFNFNLCLHSNSFNIMEIDLVTGFYALSLLPIFRFLVNLYDRNFKPFVILWTPFGKFLKTYHRNWNVKTSLVDSFATFILLSSGKFLGVCFDTLTPVEIHIFSSSNTTKQWGIYSDAYQPLLEFNRHTILALAVLIIFIIFPTVLLFVYQFIWFQKCLNSIPIQWQVLHTFMDSFQGSYKNGVDQTTMDFRWFSSIFLLLRLLLFILYAVTLSSGFFCLAPFLIVTIAMSVILCQPFKSERDNCVNTVFLLLLSTWYVGVAGANITRVSVKYMTLFFYILCAAIAVLPIIFLAILFVEWLNRHKMFVWKLSRNPCDRNQ